MSDCKGIENGDKSNLQKDERGAREGRHERQNKKQIQYKMENIKGR